MFFFFSVLPVFIVVKHRRHLGSSGDEGCLDEDDKITSGYRSGNWNATACSGNLSSFKGLLFHTVHVVQLDNSRLVFGDNFGIIIHKYPYSHTLSSLLYHLSIAVLLGEAVLLYTHLNAISNSHEQ